MSGFLNRLRRAGRVLAHDAPEVIERPMIATHQQDSGTTRRLLDSNRLDELYAPSIGISTPTGTQHLEGFGDVSFVVRPESIDPYRTHVYARDAYTPTMPRVRNYLTSNNPSMNNPERLREWIRDMPSPTNPDERALPHIWTRDDAMNELYGGRPHGTYPWQMLHAGDTGNAELAFRLNARNAGDTTPLVPHDVMQPWLDEVLARHNLSFGPAVYDAASRTHRPANAENVIAAMGATARSQHALGRQVWRGAEDAGSPDRVLATLAPSFRDFTELQHPSTRRRLLDEFTGEEGNRYPNWIKQYYSDQRVFGGGREMFDDRMRDAVSRAGLDRLHGLDPVPEARLARLREEIAAQYPDADPRAVHRMANLLEDGRDLPTGYFEAKPQRGVRIGEDIVGAVVHSGVPGDVTHGLRDRGLRVVERAYGAPREEAYAQFADQFFTPPPLALGIQGIRQSAQDRLLPEEEGLL